jgi:hypothetical protein
VRISQSDSFELDQHGTGPWHMDGTAMIAR